MTLKGTLKPVESVFAIRIIAGDRSIPIVSYSISARGMVVRPVPHPTSRTRPPGLKYSLNSFSFRGPESNLRIAIEHTRVGVAFDDQITDKLHLNKPGMDEFPSQMSKVSGN